MEIEDILTKAQKRKLQHLEERGGEIILITPTIKVPLRGTCELDAWGRVTWIEDQGEENF